MGAVWIGRCIFEWWNVVSGFVSAVLKTCVSEVYYMYDGKKRKASKTSNDANVSVAAALAICVISYGASLILRLRLYKQILVYSFVHQALVLPCVQALIFLFVLLLLVAADFCKGKWNSHFGCRREEWKRDGAGSEAADVSSDDAEEMNRVSSDVKNIGSPKYYIRADGIAIKAEGFETQNYDGGNFEEEEESIEEEDDSEESSSCDYEREPPSMGRWGRIRLCAYRVKKRCCRGKKSSSFARSASSPDFFTSSPTRFYIAFSMCFSISGLCKVLPTLVFPSTMMITVEQLGTIVMVLVSYFYLGKRYRMAQFLFLIVVLMGILINVVPEYENTLHVASNASHDFFWRTTVYNNDKSPYNYVRRLERDAVSGKYFLDGVASKEDFVIDGNDDKNRMLIFVREYVNSSVMDLSKCLAGENSSLYEDEKHSYYDLRKHIEDSNLKWWKTNNVGFYLALFMATFSVYPAVFAFAILQKRLAVLGSRKNGVDGEGFDYEGSSVVRESDVYSGTPPSSEFSPSANERIASPSAFDVFSRRRRTKKWNFSAGGKNENRFCCPKVKEAVRIATGVTAVKLLIVAFFLPMFFFSNAKVGGYHYVNYGAQCSFSALKYELKGTLLNDVEENVTKGWSSGEASSPESSTNGTIEGLPEGNGKDGDVYGAFWTSIEGDFEEESSYDFEAWKKYFKNILNANHGEDEPDSHQERDNEEEKDQFPHLTNRIPGYAYWECSPWRNGVYCDEAWKLTLLLCLTDALKLASQIYVVSLTWNSGVIWVFGVLGSIIGDSLLSIERVSGPMFSSGGYYNPISCVVVFLGALGFWVQERRKNEKGVPPSLPSENFPKQEYFDSRVGGDNPNALGIIIDDEYYIDDDDGNLIKL